MLGIAEWPPKLSSRHEEALRTDGETARIARGAGAVLLALGRTLGRLFRGDLLMQLGYARQADYARERLGVAPRTMFYWLALATGLRERPFLRRAVLGGLVSPRKAVEILSVAVGDDERTWTAAAMGCSVAELRKAMRSEGREPPPSDGYVAETIDMTPEQQGRLDAAIAAALELIGFGSPRWMCEEAVAQEWLGTYGQYGPDENEELEPVGEAWSRCASAVERQMRALDEAVFAVESDEEEGIVDSDALGLDGRARRLVAAWKSHDLAFGAALLRIVEHRTWQAVGYRSFAEYCRERLGRSARAVRDRVFLERRMRALPALREALARSKVTFSKAAVIARDATPANVEARIEEAAATTCQQIERAADARAERKNRAAGVRQVHGPRDAMETVTAAIASCQAWSAAQGSPVGHGEAFARIADHFVSVHQDELARKRIPAARREVLMRHGGLCAVPGCTRPAQHLHHICFRSHGGTDDRANLVGLCAAHHQRGIHWGRLHVTGRGGELLVWELGTGEVFETHGDDDVRRVAGRRAAMPAA